MAGRRLRGQIASNEYRPGRPAVVNHPPDNVPAPSRHHPTLAQVRARRQEIEDWDNAPRWRRKGPRPEALEIVPFLPGENRRLRLNEDPQPFQSVCECPGCGSIDLHYFAESDRISTVVRECLTCSRQWDQS